MAFLNTSNQKGVITNKRKFWFLTRLKVNIRKWTDFFNLPIANVWETKTSQKYDLIHCAHCLSKNNDRPWVADMESLWSMWVSGMNTTIGKSRVRRILESNNCKKIMPWTQKTEKEIINYFPEIKDKLEIIYPAVQEQTIVKKNNAGAFTVTFIGRDFRLKGGKIALATMKKIKKRVPNSRMIFISSLPKEIDLKKYKEIELYDLISNDEVKTILSQTDIFLYPSLMDTFGFTILEAMSFGVPTVALKTKLTGAIDEIISDGVTGFVLPTRCTIDNQSSNEVEKTSNLLSKKIIFVAKNKKLREKMSNACMYEIKNGKFSIKERNKKLQRIYREALK